MGKSTYGSIRAEIGAGQILGCYSHGANIGPVYLLNSRERNEMRKNNGFLREISIVVVLAVSCFMFNGCAAHLPRGTVDLSGKVTTGIAEAKRTHNNLIRQFTEESRARIEERLALYIAPRTIRNILKKKPKGEKKTLSQKACSLTGMDQALEVQKIFEAVDKKVMKIRKDLMGKVRKSERIMISESEEYFDYLEGMSSTVTQTLKAVHQSQEFEEEILKKAKERIPLIDRLDKERDKLNNILEAL